MNSEPKKKPRGILKKVSEVSSDPLDLLGGVTDGQSKRDAARETAIHHARILQQRKDLEAQIFDDLVILSEYPKHKRPPYSALSPSASDISDFKHYIRNFQPSHYDDLIEERNANGFCGYTLCPKPRRKVAGKGSWKLVNSSRDGHGIVERKELERWCSQDCAKRALWVKVQLNESAAWERAGMPEVRIDLYEEDKLPKDPQAEAFERVAGHEILSEQKDEADAHALAMERGDAGPSALKGLVEVTIREKETKPPLPFPEVGASDDDHLLLEGYRTR